MSEVDDAGTEASTDRAELAGCMIGGKYYLEQYIGSGSTGAVYRARHSVLEKPVALKILDLELARSPEMVELFKREAKAASRLDHPNSVRVLDFGTEGSDLLYIVMEFVEGPDLLQLLDDEFPLGEERVVEIMCQILGALAQAHGFGVVHRDLKPENVLLLRATSDDGHATDVVKVCDFGVAQLSPVAVPTLPLPRTGPEHPTVIDINMLVGTPEYMSPEQARGEALDPRSDVYAAGVVLFQLLTRHLPFTAESASDVAMLQCYAPLPRPSSFAPISAALEAICMKALNKDPAHRYQSAREMRVALRQSAQLERAPTLRLSAASSAPPAAGASAMTAVAELTTSSGALRVPALATAAGADTDTMNPPAARAARARTAARLRRPAVAFAALSMLPAVAAAAYLWPGATLDLDDFVDVLKRRGASSALSATAGSQPTALAHAQPVAQPGFDALAASVVDAAIEPAPMMPAVAPSRPEPESDAARARRAARRASKAARAAVEPTPESTLDAAALAFATDEATTDAAMPIASAAIESTSPMFTAVSDASSDASSDVGLTIVPKDEPVVVPTPTDAREPSAESGPRPEPAKPVETLAVSEPLQASARIHDVAVRGSLATSVVERALRRVRPQLSACYARAAQAAGRNGFGQVTIDVEFDERGRARRARADGGALPGLDACVSEVAGRVATRQAPDTGTVKATWTVAFER
jgi:serine/threonine-protein kinase